MPESDWSQWRGPHRTGIVKWLPETLSPNPKVIWEVPLGQSGLGGIAATDKHVFFGDRDLDNFYDVFRCLDAVTGEQRWEVQQLAIGTLDYGNSPRATPLVDGEYVVFLGAFGDLVSVHIPTGKLGWHINLRSVFKPTSEFPWGYCGSPLLVQSKLIVTPGANSASLVALDPRDGKVIWKSPGQPSAYGSLIADNFGGHLQVVGHDAKSIGGWDVQTGKRLWTVTPPYGGEFNVPTPININGSLLVSTEQNGTRMYGFDSNGVVNQEPIARNAKLTPDMSSPVVVDDNLFCVNKFLYCLDVANGLQEKWRIRDRSISDYGSLIASKNKLLVVGDGEVLLFNSNGDKTILARQRIFDTDERLYSHPALVGNKFYVRGETRLRCIEFSDN